MSYVLLVYIMAGSSWRPMALTAEFSSRERCEAAGSAYSKLVAADQWTRHIAYVCAQK